MMSVETPDWVRDAIFYQIFPDRFASSRRTRKPSNLEPWDSPPTTHGFKGGDLLGIVERLDYLQDLGITAILLNPIFQSTANHRYHTHDYYAVDPILGGNAAFRKLLDETHRRGMRVVLDGVFNHASRSFFQFSHIAENGPASPYLDWFIVNSHPLRPYHAPRGEHGYEAWWNMPALPKLNVSTPAVREFLWDVACHWIRFGADGWRLDVPAEIDDDSFWREFRLRIKSVDPEAYIVGEIWHDAQRWLQGDQFDAVMNYMLTRACLGFFAGAGLQHAEAARCGYNWIEKLNGKAFADEVQRLHCLYPRSIRDVQLNLLGSHDTPRFRTLAGGDDSAYRLSVLFLMTVPGAPCIYYGDEIGMLGRHDPDCRRAFPWNEDAWDGELRDHVRKCIALRRANSALRRGDFQWLLIEDQILVHGRRTEAQTIVVLLNNGSSSSTVNVPVGDYLAEGAVLRDVWGQATATVNQGCLWEIRVPARSGIIFDMVRNSA